MKIKHFLIVAMSLSFLSGCGNLNKGITNINEGEGRPAVILPLAVSIILSIRQS